MFCFLLSKLSFCAYIFVLYNNHKPYEREFTYASMQLAIVFRTQFKGEPELPTDELLKKASAYYQNSYKNDATIPFPWKICGDYLCIIKAYAKNPNRLPATIAHSQLGKLLKTRE